VVFVRLDGTVLAGAWLPALVGLGEVEPHLGDGAIEAMAGETIGQGRLSPRKRRRIMSYPPVVRPMPAMTLTPDSSQSEALADVVLTNLTGASQDLDNGGIVEAAHAQLVGARE
jgi:hypothetical protein